MEFYRPCPLDTDKHRREEFDCTDASLNEWLRRYAGQNRRRDTAATWVVVDDQSRVMAYACVSMTSVDRSAAPDELAKGTPRRIPALLIGRLGVDRRAAGHGLGTALVVHILQKAVEINHTAACRAVVVDALNPDAFRWWVRFGFVPFDPEDEHNLDLYLLTADIERTIEALER
ncbi:GNAT family N-acetyltransferase [Mycolicibacterium sp. 120270]|uniref:GNAT family N-acetyltransferase n=1 Tax=Mycolicibacterium sp. 120270 TaxID=3090600 RepID=UPI00299D9F04|nr:GNAT family N-acetyltransferase [Mycolicibacterium sp. 120270]MDX1887899.1 GNAT family N-acetyltransferase [Mycolicibacterium sp. 120270]